MNDSAFQKPYDVVNAASASAHMIICDHASNYIPPAFSNLGLPPERLQEHIAYDIGSAAVGRGLAEALDCSAFLCGTSRLVIDCNRTPGAADRVPPISDGIRVPGNEGLSDADIKARVRTYFDPYHKAIEDRFSRIEDTGQMPFFISIHSFTPEMDGFKRPWHVGILSDEDRRVADPLLENLRAVPGLVVGDNEPYSGRSPLGYALKAYNIDRGLPCAVFEIRQDLVTDQAGIDEWVEICATVLRPIIADKPWQA